MSRIRSTETNTEIKFRKYLWKNNIRGYRKNFKVNGKPDVYFSKQKIAVFIDGCFWHKCPTCFVKPKTNNKYWSKKIKNNTLRDKRVNNFFKKEGIIVVRFWEHEIKYNLDNCLNQFRLVYEKNI